MEKTLKLGEKQFEFVSSDDIVPVLIGPQGEGKTFAGFIGALYHRQRQPSSMRVMKCCIIRDMFTNISRMTIPSIRDAADFAEVKTEWHEGGKKLIMPGIEVDLFGIDSIGSLTRLQGAEYSLIWLEEPAPILDKANAGLRKEVFDVSLSRVARQRNSVPRLQITMNPADEDHWTFNTFVDNPFNMEVEGTRIKVHTLFIPYGENKFLSDIQRHLVKTAYKDSPELYQRYVEGKFSFITLGEKVTPEYKEETHRSKEILMPMEGVLLIRMWDGGLNPTCIIGQVIPTGKLRILDTIRGENIGLRQLINEQLRPLLNNRYYKFDKMEMWRDIGDPAMTIREQSDSDQAAQSIISDELGGSFECGPSHWVPRRESLKEVFKRMVGGDPMLEISHHEGILHRALKGGWHYKTDNSGRVISEKPFKDIHSHPGDAFSYGVGKLLPWKPRWTSNPKIKENDKRRAQAYATRRK